MKNLKRIFFAAAISLGLFGIAFAANTVFFTSKGDVVIGLTPTTLDGVTIGGTSSKPGTFTNLTATGTISGAGFTGNFAAPPPIGSTTPNTGAFSTLAASGAVTGAGFTARLATPGPIGNTVASTGAFTTLTASGQITSTTGAPTITSGACGATTNGTITGTNQSGVVTIGSASTSTCTISFSATLASAPASCVIAPASTGAAAQETTHAYVSSISTTTFVITGTLASTKYNFICL